MIRNSARNIFLSLIQLNYTPLIEYLCDIPRMTVFIILVEKIKSYILLMNNLKNNNSQFYLEKTIELKDKMIEDLLFIQDIFSINIYKINYVLINCLFSILFRYIFEKISCFSSNSMNIKLKSEISKSINILKIILKNIKIESVKNLIFFLIYSDKVYSEINKYLNIDNLENNNIRKENLSLLNLNNFIFNYNYSKIQFEDYIILNYSQNFLKSIRYINKNNNYNELNDIYEKIKNNDNNDDIKVYNQSLNEIFVKDRKNFIIRMYNYHDFISKITGVNCGILSNGIKNSFIYIMYYNFLLIQSNIIQNNNINNLYQNNILKKEILLFLKNEIENNNNINSIFNVIIFLIHTIHDININQNLKQLMNIKINYQEKNLDNINHINKRNINIETFNSIINKPKELIYPDNIPEPTHKFDNINPNKENNSSQYIIINNEKVYYKELNYDNNNNIFIKLSENPYYINNNEEIIISTFNFIFSSKFILNNNHIILCFNLIDNLINKNQNSKKILDLINIYYIITLKEIKEILFINNNDINNEIFKYSYALFEECFNLNKKDINEIIKIYNSELQSSSYKIIEKSLMIKEKLKLKYLFQKFISLHDLKILSSSDNNNNILFKNMLFPLNLIKNELFDIGGKIDLKEYKIEQIEVYFIKKYKNNNNLNEIKENLNMFIYNNYLFFALSPDNIGSFDINAVDDQDKYFIKYKYALRNIKLKQNIQNNELSLEFQNESKFKILLFFKNNNCLYKGRDLIFNGINDSTILEYSSITSFINNYIGEYYKNNK